MRAGQAGRAAESAKEGFLLPRARIGALIGAFPLILSCCTEARGAPVPAIHQRGELPPSQPSVQDAAEMASQLVATHVG